MSRKGNCYDNAVAESFLTTLPRLNAVLGMEYLRTEKLQGQIFSNTLRPFIITKEGIRISVILHRINSRLCN